MLNEPEEAQSAEGNTAPRVGDVVHYVSYGTPGGEYSSRCRAAMVTEVGDTSMSPEALPALGLCVVNPTGQFFNTTVSASPEEFRGGTWHDRTRCTA